MEIENRLQQIFVYLIAVRDGCARGAGSRPAVPWEHALTLLAAHCWLSCVHHLEIWVFKGFYCPVGV